ncbi:MAG: hypothetical protein IJM24_07115 [Clostridia bacterium]|nr:hypothetical protein [Clostridia bacterium]
MAKGLFNIDTAAHQGVKENVVAGILGAFLFALGGGLLYLLLAQVGFIAGISGMVAVFLAIKGYSVFAKGLSKRGLIISVVIAFLVLILAWYVSLTIDVYKELSELYKAGDLAEKPKFFECVMMTPMFFKYAGFLRDAIVNLVLGLLFAVAGSFTLIANISNQIKQNQQYAAAQAANNQAAQAANAAANLPEQTAGAVGNVYDAAYTEADAAANEAAQAADDAVGAAEDATVQLSEGNE